jgi:hypothetical protein
MSGVGPVTRKREILFPVGKPNSASRYVVVQPPFPTAKQRVFHNPIPGTQITTSEGHPWRSRSKRSLGDIGGDFSTQRQYLIGNERVQAMEVVRGSSTRYYSGPIFPVNPYLQSFPPSLALSNAQLDQIGATAVSRCKPTNSVANAAVFLGELRKDGLPHLPGSSTWADRTQIARAAGKEYLNAQFGWRPLVNDITSFGRAVRHADAVLKQYERDAGKVVRRRYNFPLNNPEPLTAEGQQSAWFDPTDTSFLSDTEFGRWVRTTEVVQRVWYSGAFTYYLPTGSDSRSRMGRYALEAKKLFGLSLSPDTLWNLAPWTWAVDWFSNTGDVVSNVSDYITDGLVQRYGYVMCHTIHKVTFTSSQSGLKTGDRASPISFVTETKQRRRANPFGFGLSWDGLSPFQLSIAAALGLART